MKTLSEIKEGLNRAIPAEVIHPADSSAGIYGEYITAQWAMQEANNIFDVDGIVSVDVLDEKVIEIPIPGESFGNYVFITTVRVNISYLDDTVVVQESVTDEGGSVIVADRVKQFSRPGRGVGTAQCPYDRQRNTIVPVKTQQMDTAAKAALSDAIKNALMRTGQRLGAELYFDERTAQALDFMIASDRVTRQSEESGASPDSGDELERLATLECKYGFGKDKDYKGMTLAEMWNDEEARKVFDWAVEREATGFFNEKMRRYHELMTAQQGDEKPPAEGTRMITIWTGDEKPADEKPKWANLATNEAFLAMLRETFDPDGKIKYFGPNHKRMVNHYKAHFGVDSGADLTWEMLNALVARCKEGEDAAAFGYPEWYGSDVEQFAQDELEGVDVPDEVLARSLLNQADPNVHDTPQIVIGPAKNQKLPSGVQKAVRELGVKDADTWLWVSLLAETPVGEWTEGHTDLAMRIIETIEEGKITYDNANVIGSMWTFGTKQLA